MSNLNDTQMGKYQIRNSWDPNTPPNPAHPQEHQYSLHKSGWTEADLMVHRYQAKPGASLVTPAREMDDSYHYNDMRRQRYNASQGEGMKTPEGHVPQARLFAQDADKPERNEAFSLMAKKDVRHMVPTLLGVAENDMRARTGQGLTVPSDLSAHSARMVQKLQGAGAVPKDAPNQKQNTYDFDNVTIHHVEPGMEDYMRGHEQARWVGTDEMRAGAQTMRDVLRKGKKPGIQPRGAQQMSLPF